MRTAKVVVFSVLLLSLIAVGTKATAEASTEGSVELLIQQVESQEAETGLHETTEGDAQEPVWLASGVCSAQIHCDDDSHHACSCSSHPGSCVAAGNPWGGTLTCDCPGTANDYYYACNEQSSCTPRSCDTQCGGPGYGTCVNGNCYCY